MNNSLKDWVNRNLANAESKRNRLGKIKNPTLTERNNFIATGGKITVLKQVKDWVETHPGLDFYNNSVKI